MNGLRKWQVMTKLTPKQENSVGRPKMFQSVEIMQEKIDEYFKDCKESKEPLCITGLCIALSCDRVTLLNYSKDEEFFSTIKKAKLLCENYAEKQLYKGRNVVGSIFNLKNNYGWREKTEVEHSGDIRTGNIYNIINQVQRDFQENSRTPLALDSRDGVDEGRTRQAEPVQKVS